jgi:hypothetical protein
MWVARYSVLRLAANTGTMPGRLYRRGSFCPGRLEVELDHGWPQTL